MNKPPAETLTPTVSITSGKCDSPRHACNSPLSEGVAGATNPATDSAREAETVDVEPQPGRTAARNETQETYHVYRFYGQGDELLYVGQSSRLPKRLSQHRREKDWWAEVVRIELDRCESRAAALTLERALIAEHRPPFNKALNPRPSARRNDSSPQAVDVPCCPACGAPELLLNYRLPATFCWGFIEGQPEGEDLKQADWYRLDSEELSVECSYCGDTWPLDYGPDLCTDAEAETWYKRHPEVQA